MPKTSKHKTSVSWSANIHNRTQTQNTSICFNAGFPKVWHVSCGCGGLTLVHTVGSTFTLLCFSSVTKAHFLFPLSQVDRSWCGWTGTFSHSQLISEHQNKVAPQNRRSPFHSFGVFVAKLLGFCTVCVHFCTLTTDDDLWLIIVYHKEIWWRDSSKYPASVGALLRVILVLYLSNQNNNQKKWG